MLAIVAATVPIGIMTPPATAAETGLPVSQALDNKLSNGGEASLARTAVSGNDAYIVWQDRTITPTGVADIAFRRSADRGVHLSATANLSHTWFQDSRHPDISASGDNVYVVWQQVTPPEEDLHSEQIWFTASNDRGDTFGAPQRLDSGIAEAVDPIVVSDGDRVVVGWTASDSSVRVAASRDGGRTFTASTRVGSGQWGAARPSLAIQGKHVVAVWTTNTETGIYAARSDDGGQTFAPATQLAGGGLVAPVVALDEAGVAVAAWWHRAENSNGTIETARSSDNGATWSTPTPVAPALLDLIDLAESEGTFFLAFRQLVGQGQAGVAVWTSFGGAGFTAQALYLGAKEAALAPAVAEPTDKPTARFAWTVPDRYGIDKNGDGIVDQPHTTDYLEPKSFHLDFDACRSTSSTLITAWTWTIDGVEQPPSPVCTFGHDFPTQGSYAVDLKVTDIDGRSAHTEHRVTVKDLLVVSIGDSVASGEGNPEVPDSSNPTWTDSRCHRSTFAGPSQAAMLLEQRDPGTSVTFLSLACSGASVLGADDDHGGLLTPYNGIENPAGLAPLPPQLDELRDLLRQPDGTYRHIDALLVSIGANDVHFGDVVKACIASLTSCDTGSNVTELDQRLAELPQHYQALNGALTDLVSPQDVYLTEYFDPTRDSAGAWDLDCVAGWLSPISREEAKWAGTYVVPKLAAAVQTAASTYGWNYVGGVATQFGTHGYCANEPWIVQLGESWANQDNIDGSFHPNKAGHEVYGEQIADTVQVALQSRANDGTEGGTPAVSALGDMYLALYNPTGTVETIPFSIGGSSVAAGLPVTTAKGVTWAGGSLDAAASEKTAYVVWTDLTTPTYTNTAFETFGGRGAYPAPNLEVEKVEMVQNVDAPSFLVAGKSTTIRVQVQNDFPDTKNAFIRLKTTTALSGGGTRDATLDTTARVPAGESWIDLPSDKPIVISKDADTFSATVTIDSGNVISEANEDDNVGTTELPVVTSRVLKVLYMPAGSTGAMGQCADVIGTANVSSAFVTATFPVADADAQHRAACEAQVTTTSDPAGVNTALSTLDAMARSEGYDAAVGVVPHGWLATATGGTVAGAALVGSNAATGVPGAGALVEAGYDGSLTAHELGHLYGLGHEAGVPAPGYWPAHGQPQEKTIDFMDPQIQPRPWIGKQTLSALLTRLQFTPGDPDVITISGTVAPDGSIGASPWYRQRGLQDVALGAAGELTLQYVDADGKVLATTAFTPESSEADGLLSADLAVASGYRSFALRVPDVADTARLILKRGDAVLIDRAVSASSPSVALTSPADGSPLTPGQHLTISWTASDADGDALSSQVEVSTDSGATWVPLARNLTGNTFDLTVTRTLSGSHIRFRVVTSDGVNTGSDANKSDLSVTQPTANGRIAFTNYWHVDDGSRWGYGSDTRYHIWVMNSDGSGQRDVGEGVTANKIWDPHGGSLVGFGGGGIQWFNVDDKTTRTVPATLPQGAKCPSFSPDGTRLVFLAESPTQDYRSAVYTIGIDGSDARLVADVTWGSCPSWSPDGSRIAFTEYQDSYNAKGIATVAPDGSNRQMLHEQHTSYSNIHWSPDGQQLMYQTYLDSNVEIMNADGTGIHSVRPVDGGYPRNPSWSPDGTRIVMTYWHYGYPEYIATTATDGSDVQVLTHDDPTNSVAYRHDWWPMWETLSTFTAPTPPAPTADAGGPYSATEGAPVLLDASGSARSADGVPSFEWDLDNDGAFDDATGVVVSATFSTPGSHTARVRVTHPDGSVASDDATVTVTNVAPTVTAPAEISGAAGLPLNLLGSAVADAGAEMPTVTLDWGDGSEVQQAEIGAVVDGSRALLANHTYTAAGSYRLTITANDGTDYSAPVTVSVSITSDATPVITGVAPASAGASGGAIVRVRGLRFGTADKVTIGGNDAQFQVVSDDVLDVTVPAGAVGDAPLVVTTRGGSATFAFTLVDLPLPTADDLQVETGQDSPVVLRLTGSGGNALRFATSTTPAHGAVETVVAGLVQYTPAANFIGTDSFEYVATDENGTSTPATVTIRVGNHAPVAVDDSLTEQMGRPLTVSAADLLANDTDGDGDPLAVGGAYLTSGSVKDISFNAETGGVTLASTKAGDVSIEYLISDGRAAPVAATLTIAFRPGAASDGRSDGSGENQNQNQPTGGGSSPTPVPPGTPPTQVLGVQMTKPTAGLPLTGVPINDWLFAGVVLVAAGSALTLMKSRRHIR